MLPIISTSQQQKRTLKPAIRWKVYLQPLILALSCLFHCIVNAVKVNHRGAIIGWGVLVLLAPLVIYVFKTRTQSQSNHQNSSSKLARISRDLFFPLLFAVPLNVIFFTIHENLNEYKSLAPILIGCHWVLALQVFQAVSRNWFSNALFALALLLPINIKFYLDPESSQFQTFELATTIAIIIINISITNYFQESSAFQNPYEAAGPSFYEETIYREMINRFPEGVLVVDPDLRIKYFNAYSKRYITHLDRTCTSLEPVLGCFTDLNEVGGSNATAFRFSNSIVFKTLTALPGDTKNLKGILERLHKLPDEVKSCTFAEIPLREKSTLAEEPAKPYYMYRGYWKNMNEDASEAIEIKFIPFKFRNYSTVIMFLRQIPEYVLLERLDQDLKYKDEVLASVSHELRTPINSNLNLLAEALRCPMIPDDVRTHLLDPAYKSAKILLNLVNDILDMSQIKERKLKLVSQVCDLSRLLADCHYLFEQQCRQKGINLRVEIVKPVPTRLRTDPNRLTQVIMNLLSNAYKFTFHGTIVIRASLAYAKVIKIEVTDTGIGIKEEDQAKLMKRFEKIDLGENANHNPNGAGLGLSIANSLAVLLGPKDRANAGLKFESNYGKGTTVSFLVQSRSRFTQPPSAISSIFDGKGYSARQSGKIPIGTQLCLEEPVEEEESDEQDSVDYLEEEKGEIEVYDFSTASMPDSPAAHRLIPPRTDFTYVASQFSKIVSQKRHRKGVSSEDYSCLCPMVMVVDDDCFNVLTLRTMLSSLHVTHESALSGIECIQTIQHANKCCSSCRRFSLILVDGAMPLKDGYETIRELNEWNSNLSDPWDFKMIGCSANTDKKKQAEFIRAGAIEHVLKPLNKGDLESLLKKYHLI